MSPCLDDNAIVALLEPDVPERDRATWMAHIDSCPACRALVADAVRFEAAEGPRILVPGTTLGRYVVLETIGAGAMGIVYAAYDPQLGRKIALKLLRPDPVEGAPPAAGRGRLLREAQALARLSHPHVTSIHDVGTLGDEIFLAMELVEGSTLGAWLEAAPRDVRAIVRVLLQVGEGLVAAHAAGLIHRDLKPDNVLVDAGGRARVTDFGLARGAAEVDPAPSGEAVADTAARLELTITGMLLGTPAYMAPEQIAGHAADAATDQFSFCVTFYEALYGERPYAGANLAHLASSIERGELRAAPAGRRVPGWLRKIVLRGLAADRAARFPSMSALLAALAAGPPMSARRVAVGASALAVISIAVAIAWRRPTAETCTGASAAWSGVWADDQRVAMRDAFGRSGRASAPTAATQVERILDERGTAWRAMYTDACMATRVRGEASEAQLDLRMRCLGDRRNEVFALARLLGSADGELVDRAVTAALALPGLFDCANAHALASHPLPNDPAARAEIDRLGHALAEANALEYAGKYTAGVAVATSAIAAARTAGHAPLVAKLELVTGRLALGAHDFAQAGRSLHEAAAIAVETGDDAVTADAWTLLIRMVGFQESRPDEARRWARYAAGAIHRLGGDDEREATRLRALATVAWRREGKLDEARDLIERARGLFEQSHGPRYEFDLASCDEGLAGIEFDMARPAEALVLHERAAAARVRLFGEAHPSIATTYVNRGEDLTKLGRPAEAIPLIERAIAIMAPTHARGGDAYYEHRLAAALRAKGDFPEALHHDQLALASNALGGEQGTDWEAWALTGEGLDLLALGRAPEAVAPLERAVAERADHSLPVELAEARFALARALFATGDHERATTLAAQARDNLTRDAERFGGWYATMRSDIQRWLAAHAAAPRAPRH
jgi:eukaryotic-like serine/threonine-protein kinase